MPFSNEDKALIKNFQFKNTFFEDTEKFWKKKCKRKRLNILLRRFGKQEARTKGMRAADQSTRVLKRT